MPFRDREQAGRLLAAALMPVRERRSVILGLTRGGMPIAFEVARLLGLPLDLMVVRKIGAPRRPGYALGAIAEGGTPCLDPVALRETGLRDEEVAALAGREVAEVARQARLYRGDRAPPDLAGRSVIVVDDAVATGATARAGLGAARQRGAVRVVLAAPVVAAAVEPELRRDFDEVVALERPPRPCAMGDWYESCDPVSEEAVLAILQRARIELPANVEGGELWNGEWMGPDPA